MKLSLFALLPVFAGLVAAAPVANQERQLPNAVRAPAEKRWNHDGGRGNHRNWGNGNRWGGKNWSADDQDSEDAADCTTTTAAPEASESAAAPSPVFNNFAAKPQDDQQDAPAPQEESSSSSSSSGGASAVSNGGGKATFYGADYQTHCGGPTQLTDAIVALPLGSFNKDAMCGSFMKVTNTGNGKSVVVKVVDSCATCDDGHIDLSSSAFQAIAKTADGEVSVTWENYGKSQPGDYKSSLPIDRSQPGYDVY